MPCLPPGLCAGANVGRDHSADGFGWGPVYYISKYSMSTAYLATGMG